MSLLKTSIWILGITLAAVFSFVLFLILSWGGAKDQLVISKTSPEGNLTAELHQVITPMHGGPDTVYVSIRDNTNHGDAFGEKVFTRVYECNDLSASTSNLEWRNSKLLAVSMEECDADKGELEDHKICRLNTASGTACVLNTHLRRLR